MISDGKTKKVFRILVIEDNKTRIETFQAWLPATVRLVVASSAGRAIGILERDSGSVYGGIMLDHDLSDQVATSADSLLSGTDVVKTIINYISPDVPILIHSMNPKGSRIMARMLEGSGFDVTVVSMELLDKVRFTMWLEEARELWED